MSPVVIGTRAALFLAALPAIGGSLLVMQVAGASRSLLVQQIVVSVMAIALGWMLSMRASPPAATTGFPVSATRPGIVMASTLVALVLPLIVPFTDAPHRWIIVGGLRLYMAALVLPVAVLSLSDAWPGALAPIATILTGVVLAAHPDASQVTAFAGAMSVGLLWSWRRPLLTLLMIAALTACSWYAWQQPDPLLPVPYVEGVLDVAASGGRLAWLAAIACIALPPIVLVWQSSATRQRALLAPAVYYVIIGLMAWRQLTPMPLLGFGASPVLGYFLMAGLAARRIPRTR